MSKNQKLTLIIAFLVIISDIFELIHEGFFRDNHPMAKIPEWIPLFFIISLLIGCALFVWTLSQVVDRENMKFPLIKITPFWTAIILMFGNILSGYLYAGIVKSETVSAEDYISSEFYNGISLDELKMDFASDTEILLYIGREDCGECKLFEDTFQPVLSEYHTEIPAYYTTQDRDGVRKGEMYELLKEWGIESVPCVIRVKDSVVLQIWDDPLNKIEEIKYYL